MSSVLPVDTSREWWGFGPLPRMGTSVITTPTGKPSVLDLTTPVAGRKVGARIENTPPPPPRSAPPKNATRASLIPGLIGLTTNSMTPAAFKKQRADLSAKLFHECVEFRHLLVVSRNAALLAFYRLAFPLVNEIWLVLCSCLMIPDRTVVEVSHEAQVFAACCKASVTERALCNTVSAVCGCWHSRYNRRIFQGKLPHDLSITWNAYLKTTAGCVCWHARCPPRVGLRARTIC